MSHKVRVGISVGDLSGIGWEIIIKSLRKGVFDHSYTPVIYASGMSCDFYLKKIGVNDFDYRLIDHADQLVDGKVNVLNVWQGDETITPGAPTPYSGKKAWESLKMVSQDLLDGKVDVLVTAPIDKKNIQSDEFDFPGHTEYLAKISGEKEALMFLVSDKLRVGVLTGHVPLWKVPSLITEDAIIRKVQAMHHSLQSDFAIANPKIAVMGLNPHAGDNGLIGKEDQEIIAPAIDKLKAQGIEASGPFPADGLFGSSLYHQFDGILGMYHDQGLIPFKALAFEKGVNFTAGLPIIRTSPDHGTAYDIAGKNQADPTSFQEAIGVALAVFEGRNSK